MPQCVSDALAGCRFDDLANEQVADVRIAPAVARLEIEAIRRDALEQLCDAPGLVAAPNRLMIGGEIAIVRDTGAVLQQLPQRIRAAVDPVVEAKHTAGDQLQRRRRQRRLGEAPPRDKGLFGATSAARVDARGEERSIPHLCDHNTPRASLANRRRRAEYGEN
jgi:hypothetical protein